MSENPALERAVLHLVGQSRSWLHLLVSTYTEIAEADDERAARVLEALEMTTAEPVRPGTLLHVERAATELLRSMTAD